ncbi:uncharacterized protein LOC123204119 [Mangifera indica]|uniref:uncharacterized protein LOC123204119 n=1 Tax=Mangifera indica TaxID=29780 RepID=UPI001CFBAE79|nr:uncharacterized protein LOC123204119 [Mangifera indica]
MVKTRMEGRVKDLEENLKSLTEKVTIMDERFVNSEHQTTFRFDKLDENLHEIRQLLLKDTKGKDNETVVTPTVTQEPPQFFSEPLNTGANFGFQQPIPPPQQPPYPHSAGVAFGESSRNHRPPRYAAPETTNRRDHYHRKLEMPLFSGVDSWGWAAKVERYFQMNGMDERERLAAVMFCLEGEALSWFQFRELWRPFREWREVKEELLLRFGSTQHRTPYEQIILHRQTGTVAEYRSRFEQLVAMLPSAPAEWVRGAFTAGLKHRIQAELRLQAPADLFTLMQQAADIEERDRVVHGPDWDPDPTRAAQAFATPSSFQPSPSPFPSSFNTQPNHKISASCPVHPNAFSTAASSLVSNHTSPHYQPPTQTAPTPNPTHKPAHQPDPYPFHRPDSGHNFPPTLSTSQTHSSNISAPNSAPPSTLSSVVPPNLPPSEAIHHSPHTPPTPNQPPIPFSPRFNSFSRRPNLTSRPEYPRLSQSEIQTRIAQGLCFKCAGKFGPNHQCPFKQLRLMLCDEDEQDPTEFSEDASQLKLRNSEEMELSRHSVAGISTPKTLKFLGKIHTSPVIILVDSGASHSFISQQLVNKLQLPCSPTTFQVIIGNGSSVAGGEKCPGVELLLPEMKFLHDYFVFPLGNVDVILGVDWLATLGVIKSNWQDLTMVFHWEGRKITLQGDPSLVTQETSLKAVSKSLKMGTHCYWIQLAASENISEEPPEAVQRILVNFQHLFEEPMGLPPCRKHDHAIRLFDGVAPPNVRPYRYPHHQKTEIERQVREMLHAGIIRPSHSPFSSPVLLVQKKDGGWRFCVDYRALNKITIPDKFPIPAIDELLDELSGATIFTKLDLKSGYHQIRIIDSDVEKTAFRTHNGHYEFLVMPFGLSNAPATFQALMNEVFRAHLRQFILVFFDDILIYSSTLSAHLHHLSLALQLLSDHHLLLNRKKCSFGVSRLEYLGHIISAEGVAADPQKIQCMIDWPRPRDITALRGFLGLTGYYRRFVRHYGQIAAPLTQLLKKNSFHWNEDSTVAFERLKTAMTTVPVLAMPDFTQPFLVETDASSIGVGAVLMQGGRPISFMSQALSPRNKVKSVYERELMAIVLALQKWRHYLLGKHFIVRTDQKSLKHLMDQTIISGEQQRWVMKLLGFDFEIQYRPGMENKAADALSRLPEASLSLHSISAGHWIEGEVIDQEVRSDSRYKQIIQQLLQDPSSHANFLLKNGTLFYKNRLVMLSSSALLPALLREFHSSPFGGHSGFFRTYKKITAVFFWIGMKKCIRDFVAHCEICQRNKYQAMSPAGLLQPLPIPDKVWEDISMDFIGGLPRTKKGDTILVVVDRLTKYSHFLVLSHPYTAKEVAALFGKEIVRLHGYPRSIVSDRDRLFMSQFWGELFRSVGTTLKFSSAYHPQSDGQTEIVNRGLETYLRCFCSQQPKDWVKWITWAEYWYNTTFHSSLGMTPFKALYGRDPPTLFRWGSEASKIDEVGAFLQQRDAILLELKQQLHKAQDRMKRQADLKRRELHFEVGEQVFLKIQPYRFRTLAKKLNEKLSPRFYGPYVILEKIGAVAYRLALPSTSKIHPVFHVSQLKRVLGAAIQPQPLPGCLSGDLELQLQPEALLDTRYSKTGHLQVLIKWHSLPDCENSWEDYIALRDCFPEFHLEDKVRLRGGVLIEA